MNLKYIIAFLSIFPILIIGCTDKNQLTNDDLTEIDNRAPILLMHANWMRIEPYGLVGALDDDDVAHVLELAPRTRVRRFKANHVIHRDDPRGYIRAIREFRGPDPS